MSRRRFGDGTGAGRLLPTTKATGRGLDKRRGEVDLEDKSEDVDDKRGEIEADERSGDSLGIMGCASFTLCWFPPSMDCGITII